MIYLGIQICLKIGAASDEVNIEAANIILKVEADSKNEAIGKFHEKTKNIISTHRKLDIEMYETDKIETIL